MEVFNSNFQDWEDLCEVFESVDALPFDEWILSGSIGIWSGRHIIEPEIGTFQELMDKCLKDGDEVTVDEHNLEYSVHVVHHDGINYFTIKPL